MKNLCKKILLAYLFVATYCLMAQNVFELSVSEDKKSPYDKSISQIKINSFNGIKIVDTSDGCAFSFPGNNLSAIDIGNPEILEKLVTNENYTVTLNLKTDMELKPFAKATILAKTGLGGNDGGPWLGISRDFKTGYCLYANLGDEEMYSAPVNVNDDKWHTCIYAFDLKDKTAYIVFDGKLVLKKSFSKMPSSNNFMWEIGRGRDAGGGQPYKGLLNNLTIGKDVTLPFLKSDNKQQSTTRNLLFNGSFEHGTNGWFPEFPLKIADKDIGGSYGLNQAIKPEAAYDGDVGLSIFLPEWHNQPITSSWFKVDGAGKYTVSFYAKAQNKNAKLEVKINGAFKTPHETFEIAQQWQRYTFTALIYPEQERKLLQLELCPISAEANNLFIDSIMFYPGETSALEKYSVKDPVEVSIDVCNNKKHILLDNEPCNLEITAFSEKERNVELCLDGIDFKNNPLPSISQKLTLHAGKYFKLNISRPVPGKGFFLIRATISENDKKLGENFCGIAVFDAATALLPYSKEYRVGNEFMLNDDSILFNKKMGSGIIKLMDCGSGITNWIYLEPSEGRFMFTSNNNPSRAGGEFGVNTDFIERAKYVRASGVATMGVLYRTPTGP